MAKKEIPQVNMTPKLTVKQTSSLWWLQDLNIHEHVWSVVNQIENDSRGRINDMQRHARLYSNRQFMQLQLNGRPMSNGGKSLQEQARLTLNLVKSCVDTAAAKIAQSRPRPQFLASGGDFELQQRAKLLTKFTDGLFALTKVYQTAQQAFSDALVFGTGVVKCFIQDGEIVVERVIADEILISDEEAYYGQPRQIHQRKHMPREQMKHLYPEFADKIEYAECTANTVKDYVTITESWHLKSSKNAKDGKHVICLSNCTLLDEEYNEDKAPFVFIHWNEPLVGFYGQGLAEELVGIQIEVNKILKNIQSAQAVCAVPRVFVDASAQLPASSFQANPDGLSIIRISGDRPTFLTAPAMPGEVYSHLDRLINKAYEITGISQLSASSKKPGGLDSGVALREFQDIESERFQLVGQRYDAMYLEIAELCIKLAKQLYEENPELNVKIAASGYAQKISWKEVEMEEDEYIIRCYPTSLLPTTPAGKLQKIQELMQAGFITKEMGLQLLDVPDLESAMTLQNAAVNDIQYTLDLILQKGEYTSPEPYQNLELAVTLGQSTYLKSRAAGVSEDKLELLRRFIDDAKTLAQPPAQPQQAPIAQPEAAPTSDLMPIAPPAV